MHGELQCFVVVKGKRKGCDGQLVNWLIGWLGWLAGRTWGTDAPCMPGGREGRQAATNS